MINRVEENYGILPDCLMGDTAYGTAELLNWILGKGIAPHSPVWKKTHTENENYNAATFTFDKQENEYICPNNKRLCTNGRATKGKQFTYRTKVPYCIDCQYKEN